MAAWFWPSYLKCHQRGEWLLLITWISVKQSLKGRGIGLKCINKVFHAIVKMMWKAQRFSNETSSNWGNVISPIQSLPTLSLQSCVLPLRLEPACHTPAYRRVVCRCQLASCPPWRHQAGFFCSWRLTKALARAPLGAAPCREQHPAAPWLLLLLPFSEPNRELQGVWAGEAMESQALKSTENKSNFLPWIMVERPFQVLHQWGGRKQTALSGAVAANT